MPKASKKPAKSKTKTKKKTTKLPAKLVKYLEKAGVDHEVLEHKTVYTAIDAANTLKKEINKIAKTLVVKADKDYYVVILRADNNLDFDKLSTCLSKAGKDVKKIKIPGEKIMENALKVKAGALSAFGKLHKIGVIVDKKMEKAGKAVFSAGSLNHSIEMAVKDFINLEEAEVGNFGIKKKIKKQKKVLPKRGNKSTKKKTAPKKKAATQKKTTAKKSTAKKTVKKK